MENVHDPASHIHVGSAALTAPLQTEQQAAKALHCSTSLLRKWRANGEGPTFIKLGKVVRYRTSDLLAFIEDGRRPGRDCVRAA